MFGYVIPDKPNMLIKDYGVYRAYYCGMCKAIGKRFGQSMRMTLNYDITLLALFAVNIRKAEPNFRDARCAVHPIAKRQIAERLDVFSTVADINAVLGYHKASDDVNDEKRAGKRIVKSFLAPYRKRAAKRIPEFDRVCSEQYAELLRLEKSGERSVDKLAHPFATIMAEAGVTVGGDGNFARLCYNLGRWIYFLDAVDDLEEDVKKGRFNPFSAGLKKEELTKEKIAEIKVTARGLLNAASYNIKELYNAMDVTVSEGALSNIIYLGLDARAEQVLCGRCKNGKKPV